MALSLSKSFPNGAVPAYHVITSFNFDVIGQTATITVSCYLDAAHFASNPGSAVAIMPPVSFPLASLPGFAAAATPVVAAFEQALMVLDPWAGAKQVA